MKKILTLFMSFSVLLAFAQPANDECAGAITLTANGGCTSGTNVAATSSATTPNPTCFTKSNDVWYKFTASDDSMVISLDYKGDGVGDLTDSELSVYSGTCAALTQKLCATSGGSAGGGGTGTVVSQTTGYTVGNTYYIRVDGASTATGDFCLGAFDWPNPNTNYGTTPCNATILYPNNATCATTAGNAVLNTVTTGNGYSTVGTNYTGCDNESAQLGAWTKFTANATTTTFTDMTAGANQTAQDITLFTGACNSLTAVSCTAVAKGGTAALATTVGTTYYALTTLPSGSTSAFRSDYCLSSTVACTPPANDNCSGALSMTANVVYTFTDYCATPDDALCSGSMENNIWYYWTVPAGWSGNTYFSLFNQNCASGDLSSGSQISVFDANQDCSSTASCVVYDNSSTDEDVTIGWTPRAGATYYITFDGYAGENCTFNFLISNVVATPLPAEISNFSANYNSITKNVDINWATLSERNTDYFDLQKSTDGKEFESIAKIKGAGNSAVKLDYYYEDVDVDFEKAYYRIKQTDVNGSYTFFDVVYVDAEKNSDISVNPNPVENKAEVSFYSEQNQLVDIMVYDITGKLVFKISEQASKGINAINLDTEGLNKGLYNIAITNGNKTTQTKFVK